MLRWFWPVRVIPEQSSAHFRFRLKTHKTKTAPDAQDRPRSSLQDQANDVRSGAPLGWHDRRPKRNFDGSRCSSVRLRLRSSQRRTELRIFKAGHRKDTIIVDGVEVSAAPDAQDRGGGIVQRWKVERNMFFAGHREASNIADGFEVSAAQDAQVCFGGIV